MPFIATAIMSPKVIPWRPASASPPNTRSRVSNVSKKPVLSVLMIGKPLRFRGRPETHLRLKSRGESTARQSDASAQDLLLHIAVVIAYANPALPQLRQTHPLPEL